MGKFVDLTGKVFGRATVVRRNGHSSDGRITWKCHCSCGNSFIATGRSLTGGHTKSCGCWRVEFLKSAPTRTHGMSGERLHHTWRHIKDRCLNKNCRNYDMYGGRGISVCSEWKESFEVFRDWAFENGYRDGLSIERIDVNKGYCPENCTWIPKDQQPRNTRYVISFRGMLQSDWAKRLGVYESRLTKLRKRLGCDLEKAIRVVILEKYI